jgi:predicted P-loop ATPase
MSDIVAQYAQAGFILFPLGIGKKGKVPLAPEWQKTGYDPGLTRQQLQGNFGVLAGEDHLIIDIDVKKGAPGMESYERLIKDLGIADVWSEETFCVQTGTGGFHIYTRKPKDATIKKTLKEYPGIDFISGNAFVVGAGCIHPDTGNEYLVRFRSPNDVCPAPAQLLELLAPAPTVIDLSAPEPLIDDDPINIERFIETLAQMPGAIEGGRSHNTYICACRGRELGLSTDICAQTILSHYNTKCTPPLEAEEVTQTVTNAYNYAKGAPGSRNVKNIFTTAEVGEKIDLGDIKWDTTEDGNLRATLNNCVNHIATTSLIQQTFRFNVFTQSIEISSKAPWYPERGSKGANIEDDDETMLRYHLARRFHLEYKENTVWDATMIVAKKRQYHPVQNYLNGLVWDGVPRIDTWLQTYLKVEDNIYVRDIGRKTLCAAVKRIFEPGCKFDFVLILEGGQGAGKSTVVNVLGRLWASKMELDPHNKDSILKMFGKWVIELSEFSPNKFSDINALRAFFSNETDNVRLPYGRLAKDFPRQSIFIGTINRDTAGYLTDRTGNRRYWIASTPCTEANPIDLIGLEQVADQLWAEAKAKYKSEVIYLTGEAAKMQADLALSRMPEEPYRVAVEQWSKDNMDKNECRASDILDYLGIAVKSRGRIDLARVGTAFKICGWDHYDSRARGIHELIYIRPLAQRVNRDAPAN